MGKKVIVKQNEANKRNKHPFPAELSDNLLIFMNTEQLAEYFNTVYKKKSS